MVRCEMRMIVVGLAIAVACSARAATVVTVTNVVRAQELRRIGLGMGGYNSESPVLKNIIPAAGFEPGHFASIVIATNGSTGTKFKQKYTGGLAAQPAGFWDGARYEVVYGPAQGRAGTVASFTHENEYTFNFDTNGVASVLNDVMVVDMPLPGFKGDTNVVVQETRPGSLGIQSCRLVSGASVYYGVDTLSKVLKPGAGKMLLVKGNWRVAFWARANRPNTVMTIRFFRGSSMFIDTTVTLQTTWHKQVVNAYVPPSADPYSSGSSPTVDFMARFDGPLGTYALLDELEVYCADHTNPSDFSDTFVNKLMELQPGIVRFWGGQFGSDLDGMIGIAFMHRTVGYQPAANTPNTYTFGLHELLQLCKVIGAEPWWVMPTMFTSQDFSRLVEYLAAPADGAHPCADTRAALGQTNPWTTVFGKIHLEFGNEIWGGGGLNDPFSGSSVGGGQREGAIAHFRFATMKSNPYYSSNSLDLIVGGQQGYPGQNNYIESYCSNHTSMAISTYFWSCDTAGSDGDLWPSLYAWPYYTDHNGVQSNTWAILKSKNHGTLWATYEMDFSSGGSQSGAVKNQVFAGAGGGIAMPLHAILNQYEFGARAQCAFSDYGYEYPDGSRLHGMFRDYEGTGRMRPKGYATAAANKGILPTMLTTTQSGDNPGWTQSAINGIGAATPMKYIASFAYRDSNLWSLLLFNFHMTDALPVQVSLPVDPDNRATWTVMTSGNIRDNNEDALNVTNVTVQLSDFSNNYQLTLHPYSLNVLTWYSAGTPHAPSNLTVTAALNGANLAWVDASGAETGFVIERTADWGGWPLPQQWRAVGAAGSNATGYTDSSAGAGLPCWYRVRAVSAAGASDASEQRRVVTGGGAVPAAPTGLTAAPDSAQSATLAWTDASANEDGFAIELAYDIPGGTDRWDEVGRALPNATAFHLEHLAPSTRQAVRVKAYNTTGTSGYAMTTFVSLPGYQPTNVPVNLQPANGALNEMLAPLLAAGDYRDATGGTSHVASRWQICLFSNFVTMAWDSGEDAAHLAAVNVPAGVLSNNLRYFWRVSYKSGGGAWTSWSAPTWFKTETQVQTITLTASQNALIRSGSVTTNFNGATMGSFPGLTPNGIMAAFMLAKFNLTPYAGARVAADADFSDGVNWAEKPFDVSIYSLTKEWNEAGVTWSNYVDATVGGAGYTNVVGARMGTRTAGTINGPYHWPVLRSVVQAWLDNAGTNNGIALGSPYANTLFFSRTYGTVALAPRLSIALQTNSPLGTPLNVAPPNGAGNLAQTPLLAASPFSHPNNAHAASRWQVSTAADFATLVWDSNPDPAHLTNIAVPAGLLQVSSRYY